MRLLIDANLAPRVVAALTDAGHDAIHVFDIGLGTASDSEILERAAADERAIVSSDSDFGTLLARHNRSTPSVVLLRHSNDLSVDEQATLLVASLPLVEDELRRGAVVTLARGRIRTRQLPFGNADD